MSMPHGTPWWLPPILAAGLSLMSALYVGKLKTTQDVTQRIATLEAHQEDTTSRLDRIEAKVDRLLDATIK